MAYPVLSGPYGLIPQNLVGGQVFAGSTRMVPIASGYANSLYFGDPVKLTTTGTLITSGLGYSASAYSPETGGTLGIFLGCEYTPGSTTTALGTGPLYGKNRYQFWAASTVAIDAVAYVVDDYDVIFKSAVVANPASTSATALTLNSYANPLMFGTNFIPVATTVNNTGVQSNVFGNSNVAVFAGASGARATATSAFRCVGLVPETAVALTASATTSSSTLTLAATNSLILPGMIVTGPGITNTTTYVTTVSTTTVTLSAAVATNQSTAVGFNFVGYPEVLLKWNFGYHAYQQAVAI